MADFRKIFSDYGYRLFEAESLEQAILDAIKNSEIRYILGIPLILEKAEINYPLLLEQAKKENVFDRLLDILSISTRIIKNKQKRETLKKVIAGKKIKKQFDEGEFKQIYAQYTKEQAPSFPSQIQYYLSFLFAKRQIDILYKIKTGSKLAKTEKEYYSRVIKKKLIAIRELANFVKEILVKE